ncbi:MAG: hypothetical protein ACKVKR_15005 [Pseudomonadales bacterium]
MTDAKKLFIKTYGCQMNVYDSERMAETLGVQLLNQISKLVLQGVLLRLKGLKSFAVSRWLIWLLALNLTISFLKWRRKFRLVIVP